MPRFKKNVDGVQEFVKFNELNEDGRYIVGSRGTFKTKPELFEETHWGGYTLTKDGWKYYESIGLTHPGRGWIQVEFLSRQSLLDSVKESEEHIVGLQNHIKKINDLLQ